MAKWHFLFVVLCWWSLPVAAAPSGGLVQLHGDRFIVDLRYNTEDNFLKKNVYREFGLDRCYVHADLAMRLQRLVPLLTTQKLRLVLWDCYRPLAVQRAMWKLVPDRRYVADPKVGSHHNRGIAVDVTLADETGQRLAMPTGFDDFTAKASPHYRCPAQEQQTCAHRARLIGLMKEIGLKPLNSEWWHYQLRPTVGYPIVPALDGSTP
ncbi:MAG: M15 family metallopeptidase [Deltaproteobacteria bacterium]|nr:M15 family metallopeptidase [Deltaproteobacteria bacterium]